MELHVLLIRAALICARWRQLHGPLGQCCWTIVPIGDGRFLTHSRFAAAVRSALRQVGPSAHMHVSVFWA